MTPERSPRPYAAAIAGAFLLLVFAQSPPIVHAAQSGTASDDKVLASFRTALDTYVALRTRIRNEVPPLRVTPDAKEIAERSDALASAVAPRDGLPLRASFSMRRQAPPSAAAWRPP